MLMEEERRAIAAYGRQMSAQGLSRGTSGNLSCFDPDLGCMAIGPSGLDYFATEPEDVVVMDLEGRIVEGTRKPSSEHQLHGAVYRLHPEARAVVHTHSTYCTTLACLRQPLRAVHYAMANAGVDEVPCAEYATYGTRTLAENGARAMGSGRAVLLANHGLVAWGGSMAEAFALAVDLEFTAELQWRCRAVGTPVVLTGAEMADVRRQLRGYGQKTQAPASSQD